MKTPFVQVLGLCGSLRRGSFNLGLLHAAQELAPRNMQISLHDIKALPFFCPDDGAGGDPEPVRKLRNAIAAADALLIATPEYNAGIPGVLKNAIDWVSQPLEQSVLRGKPTAILGCTTGRSGTERAQIQLRQTLLYTRAKPLPFPELLVSRSHAKFDMMGELSDKATRDALSHLLLRLREWTLAVQTAVIATIPLPRGASSPPSASIAHVR